MLHKWEGIVLKVRAYGESNKIVTLLTREAGKVATMARGQKSLLVDWRPSHNPLPMACLWCNIILVWGHYNKESI